MTSYLITPATVLAISLDDAKLALRVDGTALDGEITAAILGITQDLENATGHCLMPQTWRVQTDAFPASGLPLPHPAKTITTMAYRDEAGVDQVLDVSLYRIVVERYQSLLIPKTGNSFPATDGSVDAVKVDIVAQLGATTTDTPPSMKLYLELKLKQQFDPATRLERDTVQSNFIDSLLDGWKAKP